MGLGYSSRSCELQTGKSGLHLKNTLISISENVFYRDTSGQDGKQPPYFNHAEVLY